MVIGVLVAAGILGIIVFALLLIFRKDLLGVDLSARSLLRLYLYLASLAAVMVFAIGAATAFDWGMARTFGGEAVYGRPAVAQLCPTGEKCVDPAQLRLQYQHEREQREQEDLLRGATLAVFGAAFWGGHRLARARMGDASEALSALQRAYNVLGTFVFGVGTVILLPVGMYHVLYVTLLQPSPDVFAQGVGDSLSGGILAAAFWLVYLLRVVSAVRAETSPTMTIQVGAAT
jgi:phosphotransferase system  glucose/maltose/N-acetylglucosamine-specific IIC component